LFDSPNGLRRFTHSILVGLLIACVLASGLFAPFPSRVARAEDPAEEILERARSWVEAGVPFNRGGLYQGYRTDSAGFVSYAWGLTPPGLTTLTLGYLAIPVPKDWLSPGDILNNLGDEKRGHTLIFAGWVDAERTAYNAYEMSDDARYGRRAHYATSIPYPYWDNVGAPYFGLRLQSIAAYLPNDTRYLSLLDKDGPLCSQAVAKPNPLRINTTATYNAVIDDKGAGGARIRSAQFAIDGGTWIDMTPIGGKFDKVTEEVTANIAGFKDAGIKRVCGRGTDEWGNAGKEQCIQLEVFDPDAGFVTGQGTIASASGAYALDPNLAGDASFTFLARYEKGADAPTGHAELQMASFKFESASQRVLWIFGPRAQFGGTGIVNGQPGYNYTVTAAKGRVAGGDGVDKLRIKVWRESDGSIIYDNVKNSPDDIGQANLQPLTNGSVVVNR
jgi:hypothetical protein